MLNPPIFCEQIIHGSRLCDHTICKQKWGHNSQQEQLHTEAQKYCRSSDDHRAAISTHMCRVDDKLDWIASQE